MTSTITFELENLSEGAIVGGVVVSARLVSPSGSKHLPQNLETLAVVDTNPVSAVIADHGEPGTPAGQATLDLVQSSHLPTGWTYTVEMTGSVNGRPVQAVWEGLHVPDGDREFNQIIGQVEAGTAPRYVAITQAQLDALIQEAGLSLVTADPLTGTGTASDPATVAQDGIELEHLDPTIRNDLQDSVDTTQVSLAGRRITLPSHGTAVANIDLPGETFTATEKATVAGVEASLTGIQDRLDDVEAVQEADRVREVLVERARVVVSQRNDAYSLGGRVPVDAGDRMVTVLVQAVGEPDGESTFTLASLLAKAKVVRAATQLTDANSVRFSNPPDNNVYRIGVDSTGDLFFGADTADTYHVTVVDTISGSSDEHIEDVAAAMLERGDDAGADVNTTYDDAAGAVSLNIKPDTVDPAKMKFDAGTRVAGRYLTVNDDASGVKGVPAPSGGGGGSASEITPLAAVPTAVTGATGLIANVLGTLYELVASGEARNVVSGVAASVASPSGYIGGPYIAWDTDAVSNPVVVWVPDGVSVESVWVHFHSHGEHAFYGQFDLTQRWAAQDKLIGGAQYRAWAGGSDAVGEGVVVGSEFTATFNNGSADGAAINIHGLVKRWELYLRNLGTQITGYITAQVKDWARVGSGNPPASVLGDRPGPTDTEVYNQLQQRLVAGDNITFTPDDAEQTITIEGEAGGGGGSETAMTRGPAWLTSSDLPTRTYGGDQTGKQFTERFTGEIGPPSNDQTNQSGSWTWTKSADAPALLQVGTGATARSTIEAIEVPVAGQVGWIIVAEANRGDGWHEIFEQSFPFGGIPGQEVPTGTGNQAYGGFKPVMLSAFATNGSRRASYVLIRYGFWTGNGTASFRFAAVPNISRPPARTNAGFVGVASGGQPTRYRMVVYPEIISGARGPAGPAGPAGGDGPHITTLADGPAALGLASAGGQHATSAFTLFDPDGAAANFDLDDNPHGVLNVEATVTLVASGTGSNTVGFDTNTADPLREASIEQFMFAQRLSALGDWDSNQASSTGIAVGAVLVRNGSATLGTFRVYIGHNAAGQLGYIFDYRRAAGSIGLNFAVNLEASFIPNDVPGGSVAFHQQTALSADITGQAAGDEHDVLTTPAVTAAQAGVVQLLGTVNNTIGGGTAGGPGIIGIKRTRGSTTTKLVEVEFYASNTAFGGSDAQVQWVTEAQTGDTFTLFFSASVSGRQITTESDYTSLTMFRT